VGAPVEEACPGLSLLLLLLLLLPISCSSQPVTDWSAFTKNNTGKVTE
jgi:hypothetical protein